MESQQFVRVRIISKSNFKDYFNIRFMDLDRPDCGIYFRENDFWSFSRPSLLQEDNDQVDPPVDLQPPIEEERRSRSHRESRLTSPYLSQEDALRSDGVCMIPGDESLLQLSPKSRKRAKKLNLPPEQEFMRTNMARALAARPGSNAPQSRVGGFIDKLLLGRK